MRIDLSKKISLGAMAAALGLLCLYAAAVLPTGRIACLFLSSLFVYVLAGEEEYLFSMLVFLLTAGLSLLLLPEKAPAAAYILLLGHYGIWKTFLERRVKDRVLRFLLKLIYCNLAVFLGALALGFLMGGFSALPVGSLPGWSWWLLVLLLQAVFSVGDFLYSLCCKFYDNVLRNYLLPRR